MKETPSTENKNRNADESRRNLCDHWPQWTADRLGGRSSSEHFARDDVRSRVGRNYSAE